MKAIKITEELKQSNPKLFKNLVVGKVYRFSPPHKFVIDNVEVHGFDANENLQEEQGFRALVEPIINVETHKLGEIIESGENYTYETLELTEDELDANIPDEMPRVAFKLQLKNQFNLTDQQVIDAINYALNEELITDFEHYEAMMKWNQGTVIVRKDPAIMSLLPLVNQMYSKNITIEDINLIFKMYGLY